MTDHEIYGAIVDLLADGPSRQRNVAFIIAKVAADRESDDELYRVEAAIKRLIAAGKLEVFGDVSEWRHSEVGLVA